MTPHRVEVYTCEEVLVSIYGEGLATISVKEATEMFEKWITERDALYSIVRDVTDPATILKAILLTIAAKKNVVVLATIPPEEGEGEEEGDDGGCDNCGECGEDN